MGGSTGERDQEENWNYMWAEDRKRIHGEKMKAVWQNQWGALRDPKGPYETNNNNNNLQFMKRESFSLKTNLAFYLLKCILPSIVNVVFISLTSLLCIRSFKVNHKMRFVNLNHYYQEQKLYVCLSVLILSL